MRFRFITEAGDRELAYEDYLKDQWLVEAIGDKRRRFLNLGRIIISYDRQWLEEHPVQKKDFNLIAAEQQVCPVRFFLPACARAGLDSPMFKYLNDTEHICTGLLAGNRGGKSTTMFVKLLTTRGLIPCDPKWEVFTENGVKFVEWSGPKKIMLSTYAWENHKKAIWPLVQDWTPLSELGQLAKGGKRRINFKDSPVAKLKCGSEIQFNGYNQAQSVFESDAKDGCGWDEQPEEPKFDGAEQRMATVRWWYKDKMGEHLGSGFHEFAGTPHEMADREASTGADTFMMKMRDGEITKGLTSAFYTLNLMEEVPDWVFSEREKLAKKESWIDEPKRKGDTKRYREGLARLYGQPHASAGLVYDEFDEQQHVVDDFELPEDVTRYRGIDHGKKHPFVCLFLAALPDRRTVVIYDCMKSTGKNVSDNVTEVIRRSGNKQIRVGGHVEAIREGVPSTVFRYREIMCGHRFRRTYFDPRSFSRPQDNVSMSLGDLYRVCGLHIIPGSGQMLDKAIPIVSEFFKLDPDRNDYLTGKPPARRILIFRTACGPLIEAIKRYRWRKDGKGMTANARERAKSLQDDEVDAMKYLLQGDLIYVPGFGLIKESMGGEKEHEERWKDPYTGM